MTDRTITDQIVSHLSSGPERGFVRAENIHNVNVVLRAISRAGLKVLDPAALTQQWVDELLDPLLKPQPRLTAEEFENAAYNRGLEDGANAALAALRGDGNG